MVLCVASQPGYNRASKDIKSVIKLAKLNERNLTDLTQVVYYGSSDSADNFKLLELNDDLMSAIEKGESLYFKGLFALFGQLRVAHANVVQMLYC